MNVKEHAQAFAVSSASPQLTRKAFAVSSASRAALAFTTMALIFVGAAVVAFSASDSTSNARGFLDEITHAKDSNSSICDNTVVQHSGYFKLTTGKLPKN